MMQKALEEYMRNMKLGTKFLHHVAGDLPVNKHIIDGLSTIMWLEEKDAY